MLAVSTSPYSPALPTRLLCVPLSALTPTCRGQSRGLPLPSRTTAAHSCRGTLVSRPPSPVTTSRLTRRPLRRRLHRPTRRHPRAYSLSSPHSFFGAFSRWAFRSDRRLPWVHRQAPRPGRRPPVTSRIGDLLLCPSSTAPPAPSSAEPHARPCASVAVTPLQPSQPRLLCRVCLPRHSRPSPHLLVSDHLLLLVNNHLGRVHDQRPARCDLPWSPRAAPSTSCSLASVSRA